MDCLRLGAAQLLTRHRCGTARATDAQTKNDCRLAWFQSTASGCVAAAAAVARGAIAFQLSFLSGRKELPTLLVWLRKHCGSLCGIKTGEK